MFTRFTSLFAKVDEKFKDVEEAGRSVNAVEPTQELKKTTGKRRLKDSDGCLSTFKEPKLDSPLNTSSSKEDCTDGKSQTDLSDNRVCLRSDARQTAADREEQLRKEEEKREYQKKMAKQFRTIRSEMVQNLKKFESKFVRMFEHANELDLVVVMDCTGSMSQWMATAKKETIGIINSLKKEHGASKIRVGFVGFRDFCDGPNRLAVMPLSDNVEKVVAFIGKQAAMGGGDGPEDVAGGLQEAIDMDWTAGAKCVMLIGDSPCHGTDFHDWGVNGDSADSQMHMNLPGALDIRQQMRTLATSGIDFTFIAILPTQTAKMAKELDKCYTSAPVPSDGVKRKFSVVSLKDPNDTTQFKATTITAASHCLTYSKARSVAVFADKLAGDRADVGKMLPPVGKVGVKGSKGVKGVSFAQRDDAVETPEVETITPVEAHQAPLNWKAIAALKEIPALRHTYHVKPGEVIDWQNPDLKHTVQPTTIRLSGTYFAEGAMRQAHGMLDSSTNKRFAAKLYYGKVAIRRDIEQTIMNDVETQAVAKALALEFSSTPNLPQAVDFIFTCCYELTDPRSIAKYGTRYFGAEPFIEGTYKKYNNNNGWVSPDFNDTAQAFSHYSFEHSFGSLMVVDLQGVNFILTDPQIHSQDKTSRKYGVGNIGPDGILSFFYTHKCNAICRLLQLNDYGEEQRQEEAATCCSSSSSSRGGDTCKPSANAELDRSEVRDNTFEFSCTLCGSIFELLHSTFIAKRSKGCDVFCTSCADEVAQRVQKACKLCAADFEYPPFFYAMKGIKAPRSCVTCKSIARASTKVK